MQATSIAGACVLCAEFLNAACLHFSHDYCFSTSIKKLRCILPLTGEMLPSQAHLKAADYISHHALQSSVIICRRIMHIKMRDALAHVVLADRSNQS